MSSALYNRDILRLASSLVAGDHLEKPDGTAESRSPICGSRIQVDVTIDTLGKISDLAVRANACALGQASAAILRSRAVGLERKEITHVRNGVANALSGLSNMPDIWPELSVLSPAKDYPSRHAAILLPYDALLLATDALMGPR